MSVLLAHVKAWRILHEAMGRTTREFLDYQEGKAERDHIRARDLSHALAFSPIEGPQCPVIESLA